MVLLLAVKAFLGFIQVLLKCLNLLVTEPNFTLKMLNALLVLFHLLCKLMLDQLNVVFVISGFFSEPMVVLLHHLVESPLGAFFLIVVPLLKSVLFCLIECLKLSQLLLRLLLYFTDLCFVRPFFLFQLPFKILDLAVVTVAYLVNVPCSLLL